MQMPGSIPEFGEKKKDEERRDGGCGIVYDPATGEYAVGKQANGLFRLFSGGVEEGEEIEEGVLREVMEESGLYKFSYVEKIAEALCHFHNSLKNVNRLAHAVCFLVVLESRELVPVKHEDHEKFDLAWTSAEELMNNWRTRNGNKDYDHWIYFFGKAEKRLRELGYIK